MSTFFSQKNTCQNSMVNVLDKDKILWYVMRVYKNENTAEDRLSNETYGLEYFIPKQKVLRTVKGKKVFFMVPVIHSLVFVHASHQKIVDFKHNYYYDLQFVTWKSGGELVYLTVPDEDMTNFIKVCKQADEEVHFYKISEINKEKDKINIEKGKRVRVHGGPFDQVEGYFIKVAKKRGRQLVVIIPDLLAVSADGEAGIYSNHRPELWKHELPPELIDTEGLVQDRPTQTGLS